ncbi:type III-I CRISPR-associated protein Cas10i [Desulfonema magnum]|uniref:Uncharacterized protein n=1 Tax=Desulfonema magnum TaxID=45655 RepID=A0A975BNV8_9BACT|nr:hypothetical protein [Desulfonema magnum]QTA89149.1 Uncharacterized protein dnm_051980 [Desulfonema magnum]
MLTIFDWLRRSHSGSELLTVLEYAVSKPEIFPCDEEISPPISACNRPCKRCWIYPRMKLGTQNAESEYCKTCHTIVTKAKKVGKIARQVVVIWGFVSHIPNQMQTKEGFYAKNAIGSYVHDSNHFLLLIARRELKTWIQELLIYHGTDIRGLIQIFPTSGGANNSGMGEVLCRAAHQETRFPMDMLRVRFFSNPFQIFSPQTRDEGGLLTFEVTEFLRLLEMTEIFRSLLKPDEQKALRELVSLKDRREEQFYWGRFMGYLSQEAKDMLNAWKIRQWPKNRIKLLYELADYVLYR